MISKEQIFSVIYWLTLSVLIVALAVFSVMVIFQERNISYAIMSTTPIIISCCVILWVGDVTNNVTIHPTVSKAIFSSFIVVVLSNAGMLIAEKLKPSQLKLEYCSVLNEEKITSDTNHPFLTDLEERSDKVFTLNKDGDLIVVIGCKLKNFSIEENQEIDLKSEILLINDSKEIASINIPKHATNINQWENYPLVTHLGIEKVKKFFNVAPNEIIYLMIVSQINPTVIADRSALTLKFRVFDEKARKFAIFDSEIHLQPQNTSGKAGGL